MYNAKALTEGVRTNELFLPTEELIDALSDVGIFRNWFSALARLVLSEAAAAAASSSSATSGKRGRRFTRSFGL